MYVPKHPSGVYVPPLTSQTLTVFLENVLSKKYPNPSSDTITVLAGLEDADTALTGFVGTLDAAIKNGRTLDIRRKAVRAAIAAVAGAYQTGLVSYFMNRDLFPTLLKVRAGEGLSTRSCTHVAVANMPCSTRQGPKTGFL